MLLRTLKRTGGHYEGPCQCAEGYWNGSLEKDGQYINLSEGNDDGYMEQSTKRWYIKVKGKGENSKTKVICSERDAWKLGNFVLIIN